MKTKDIKLFCIIKKGSEDVWTTARDKCCWGRRGDAAQAWNTKYKEYFRNQSEYEIVEFELKKIDQSHVAANLAFREKMGLK